MKVVAKLSLVCVSVIVMSLILTGQSFAKINPKKVAAVWLFEESGGKVAKDASGNGNNGELINGPKWVGGGKFGRALELDGADDYVLVAGSASLDITDNITIVAWAKHAALAVNRTDKIFHYRRIPGGIAAYQFRFGGTDAEAGNKLILQTNTVAGGWTHAFSNADAITDTNWHHYATTASKGKVVLYLDGKVMPSQGGVAPKFDDGDQGYIGARVESNEYFAGLFDDVAIFSEVLTANDIQRIKTVGLEKALAVSPSGKLATAWGAIKNQ